MRESFLCESLFLVSLSLFFSLSLPPFPLRFFLLSHYDIHISHSCTWLLISFLFCTVDPSLVFWFTAFSLTIFRISLYLTRSLLSMSLSVSYTQSFIITCSYSFPRYSKRYFLFRFENRKMDGNFIIFSNILVVIFCSLISEY